MRNSITLCFLLLTSTFVFSQTFEDGYKKGYGEGYCYGQTYCTPPLSPLPPMPSLGQNTFTDGYNLGFLEGKKSNEPKEEERYRPIEDDNSNRSISAEHKADVDKCIARMMKYVEDLDAIHLKLLELSIQEYKDQNYLQAQGYFELSLYKSREGTISGEQYLFGAKCYVKLIVKSKGMESDINLRAIELLNKAKNNGAENTDEVRQAISDAIKG
jgi:hypothetical protein